jgi:hypothetical protein
MSTIHWKVVATAEGFEDAVDKRINLADEGINVKLGGEEGSYTISVPERQARAAKEVLG